MNNKESTYRFVPPSIESNIYFLGLSDELLELLHNSLDNLVL